jgi:hypothetical protein
VRKQASGRREADHSERQRGIMYMERDRIEVSPFQGQQWVTGVMPGNGWTRRDETSGSLFLS